jgi:hypothetical protein
MPELMKAAGSRGLLAGMPADKDLTTSGVLTTQGSPIYRNNIRTFRSAGRHLVATAGDRQINTPEFGAGTTPNEVFRPPAILDTCAAAGSSGAAWRSPPAWPGSPTAPTWAARCATRELAASGLRPSIGRCAYPRGDRPQPV